MKQTIFFILLLATVVYSQPIDTTGSGGAGLSQSAVEAIVADSIYALESRLNAALANEQLSDLSSTAVNTDVSPNTTTTYNLGAYNRQWQSLFSQYWYYYGGSGYYSRLAFADPTSSNKTITIPNETGTIALNTLSNLGSTSINADLTPSIFGEYALGNVSKSWAGVYARGIVLKNLAASNPTTIYPNTNPIAVRTIYLPDASGTIALTSDLAGYAPLANPTFTGTVALPITTWVTFGGVALTASVAQLNYLSTVTSNVQTQINARTTVATVASMISDSLAASGVGDTSFEPDINGDLMPKVD